jgi:hypothetical protein
MFKKEGDHPQNGIPAVQVYQHTFGVRLSNGKVTPCTVQGQKAEFIFGDSQPADLNADGMSRGFGVPLHSTKHSGGIAIPVLAGGVIPAGSDIIVAMVNFTVDGAVVSLPVAKAASAGVDGDWIVAKATFGSSSAAADTDPLIPSIVVEFYDTAMPVVGGETTESFLDFHVELPLVANGDVVTDFAPGFAGEIVDDQFVVTDPVTTAAKAASFNLQINGVDVTGGVIATTSANATPLGKVIPGTAVTAANTFTAEDTISVVASGVTTYVEGEGDIKIRIRSAS